MSEPFFRIDDLHAGANGIPIIKGIDLVIERGQVHAIMGPNGSGKSTLANVIMGNPQYQVSKGRIYFLGEDITAITPDERGRRGLFLAFQHPEAVPGVSVVQFLRQALTNRTGVDLSILELRLKVMEAMKSLGMSSGFADRYLNEGFSGGERKRNEVLQMAVLEPSLAIMDETDSGLDIDALKTVAEGVNRLAGPERGFLIITHYQRLLDYVTPAVIHILFDGRLVESGGPELAAKLEAEGYDGLRAQLPV